MKGEYILIVGLIVAFTWNCYLAPPGEELSYVLRRWAAWSPVVPFMFGVLMGHIFWNS